MNSVIQDAIATITSGTPQEVKEAQKAVDRFWHSVYIHNREEGGRVLSFFIDELERFDEISDPDHQSYFINTLKWPLLALGEKHFDTWATFFLHVIQHPSGKVREAAIRAISWLMLDIQLFTDASRDTATDVLTIKRNRIRFSHFVFSIQRLCEQYYEKRFGQCKYVSSLPAGVYKSLQRLITEILLRSEPYRKLYEEYVRDLECDILAGDSKKNRVLSAIRLKYLRKDEFGRGPRTSGVRCTTCASGNISIGSMTPHGAICEDCTIDEYQHTHGIATREVAAARRRRIFDVGYIFSEMYVDAVLKKMGHSSAEDLTDAAHLHSLYQMAQTAYNECFSKKEKVELEEIEEQLEIEKRLRDVIGQLLS